MNNQEVLQFIIISCIVITLLFDSGVILKREIKCKSLLWIKGLKEEGYQKIITFDSSKYLNIRVTFYIFICNKMIKLKITSKRSELDCNN